MTPNFNGAIIQYDRGKGNMVHCKVGDKFIYQYTTDGEDDPSCDIYKNLRTGDTISSTILFETGWAKQINIEL